jgi:hypothetical protein
VLESKKCDWLAAIKVHQHDSICIEKVCEHMVGKSDQQKSWHRQHTYITNGWLIVVSVPPSSLGKQEGGLVGSNKSTPA